VNLLGELCDEIAGFITKLERSGTEFLDDKDAKRFLAIDMGFHMIIINSAANARIRDILINARTMARLFVEMHDINVSKLKNTYSHHAAIYSAVKERNAEKARQAMLEHLKVSKQPALMQYHSYQLLNGLNNRPPHPGDYTLENVLSQCGLKEMVEERL
jgi:DNA-binding GntR family transcriptional regulator